MVLVSSFNELALMITVQSAVLKFVAQGLITCIPLPSSLLKAAAYKDLSEYSFVGLSLFLLIANLNYPEFV